jgi:hypothetical protein
MGLLEQGDTLSPQRVLGIFLPGRSATLGRLAAVAR